MIVPADDFALIDMLWRDWSPGYEPAPEFMRALKDTLGAPGSAGAAIGYYRSMLGTIPGDPALDAVQAKGLEAITVPTLYLHGADDGCMSVDLVVTTSSEPLFPAGLDVELVPACGSLPAPRTARDVNPKIVEFVTA